MIGEVKHLANNERYRLLEANGETYIIDMERSFWKIMIPFLIWVTPNTVFKLDDPEIVQKLKTERMEKISGSTRVSIIGISYVGGISLVPLMDYFNASMSLLISIGLLVFALMLVGLLYLTFHNNRKKELYEIVQLESLPKKKLGIKPGSFKQILVVFLGHLFYLGLCILFFAGYIETQNIMLLVITSGLSLGFLQMNRKAVREGKIPIKYDV